MSADSGAARGYGAHEAVGARAPFGDSVFGVSDLGAAWEMTSTAAEQGLIVRGGPWRDRTEPPRIVNRSFEWAPAIDVGFRVAGTASVRRWHRGWWDGRSSTGLPPAATSGAWSRFSLEATEPEPRSDAGRWRRELFATEDSLRAYVHQNLAAARGV